MMKIKITYPLIVSLLLLTVACSDTDDTLEPLIVGTILPQGDDPSFSESELTQAIKMAAAEVSEAYMPVRVIPKSSSMLDDVVGEVRSPEIAAQSAESLINDGVSVIFGASSSYISLSIIDQIRDAGIVMFSPSNTAPALTDYDDDGLYFRTTPSDILQGILLGEVIAKDNKVSTGIIFRDEIYGRGLAEEAKKQLEKQGIAVPLFLPYHLDQQEFASEIKEITGVSLDSLIVISFDEGIILLRDLLKDPDVPFSHTIYLTDSFASEDLGVLVDPENPSIVDGIKTTRPSVHFHRDIDGDGHSFEDELQEFAPDVMRFAFTSYAYDAMIITALASAEISIKSSNKADAIDPRKIAEGIVGITKDGEPCSNYVTCLELLQDGFGIDYDGVSGPLTFNDRGEPDVGFYDLSIYKDNGKFTLVEQFEIDGSER